MATPPKNRQPKHATQSQILQRAYEMYISGDLTPGDEKMVQVLDDLGYTLGAGYQIWKTQTAFREDLQVHIVENMEPVSVSTIADRLARLDKQNLTFDQFVLAAADAYYETFLGREEFYLLLRFYAMGDNRQPAITETLAARYEQGSRHAAELFTRTLDRYQQQLRRSLTIDDVTVAATALVEGYALRARVQPDKVAAKISIDGESHSVFAVAFLGVVKGLVEPRFR